jgi:DNA primase large subunit
VTIEEFETCAIDRLRVLAEIESSLVRNRSWDELKTITTAQSKKYLPLDSDTAIAVDRENQRRRDHLGHFVLRLAFCQSCVVPDPIFLRKFDEPHRDLREDLRRRFIKAESVLFRVRYEVDDRAEREEFLRSRDFGWIPVCLGFHDDFLANKNTGGGGRKKDLPATTASRQSDSRDGR